MAKFDNTPANLKKIAELNSLLSDALKEMLRQGFHGKCRAKLSVQDGTIQHVRVRVERIRQ
jgi:hypothetical protein